MWTPPNQVAKLANWTTPRDEQEALGQLLPEGTTRDKHMLRLGLTLMWVRKEVCNSNADRYNSWVEKNAWFSLRTARRLTDFAKQCIDAKDMLEYKTSRGSGSKKAELGRIARFFADSVKAAIEKIVKERDKFRKSMPNCPHHVAYFGLRPRKGEMCCMKIYQEATDARDRLKDFNTRKAALKRLPVILNSIEAAKIETVLPALDGEKRKQLSILTNAIEKLVQAIPKAIPKAPESKAA